jgi:hypothetical protein
MAVKPAERRIRPWLAAAAIVVGIALVGEWFGRWAELALTASLCATVRNLSIAAALLALAFADSAPHEPRENDGDSGDATDRPAAGERPASI